MMPELAERAHKELIELAKNVAAAPQETYVPRRLPAEVRGCSRRGRETSGGTSGSSLTYCATSERLAAPSRGTERP